MRRPVELWAKQKQTAWSACQTHKRVQSVVGTWWTSRKCSSLFSCSKGWSRRAEIILGWICHVLTSTEDNLLRELELDRPSALGGPGPRPCFCSGALNHRWREKRLCLLSIQDMCACSTPTCDDNAVAVVFLRLPASAHSHVLKGNVTAAFLQGRDTELERGPLAKRVQELSETLKLQPWSVCNLGRPCTDLSTRREYGWRRSIR